MAVHEYTDAASLVLDAFIYGRASEILDTQARQELANAVRHLIRRKFEHGLSGAIIVNAICTNGFEVKSGTITVHGLYAPVHSYGAGNRSSTIDGNTIVFENQLMPPGGGLLATPIATRLRDFLGEMPDLPPPPPPAPAAPVSPYAAYVNRKNGTPDDIRMLKLLFLCHVLQTGPENAEELMEYLLENPDEITDDDMRRFVPDAAFGPWIAMVKTNSREMKGIFEQLNKIVEDDCKSYLPADVQKKRTKPTKAKTEAEAGDEDQFVAGGDAAGDAAGGPQPKKNRTEDPRDKEIKQLFKNNGGSIGFDFNANEKNCSEYFKDWKNVIPFKERCMASAAFLLEARALVPGLIKPWADNYAGYQGTKPRSYMNRASMTPVNKSNAPAEKTTDFYIEFAIRYYYAVLQQVCAMAATKAAGREGGGRGAAAGRGGHDDDDVTPLPNPFMNDEEPPAPKAGRSPETIQRLRMQVSEAIERWNSQLPEGFPRISQPNWINYNVDHRRQEISKALRALSINKHPDKNPDDQAEMSRLTLERGYMAGDGDLGLGYEFGARVMENVVGAAYNYIIYGPPKNKRDPVAELKANILAAIRRLPDNRKRKIDVDIEDIMTQPELQRYLLLPENSDIRLGNALEEDAVKRIDEDEFVAGGDAAPQLEGDAPKPRATPRDGYIFFKNMAAAESEIVRKNAAGHDEDMIEREDFLTGQSVWLFYNRMEEPVHDSPDDWYSGDIIGYIMEDGVKKHIWVGHSDDDPKYEKLDLLKQPGPEYNYEGWYWCMGVHNVGYLEEEFKPIHFYTAESGNPRVADHAFAHALQSSPYIHTILPDSFWYSRNAQTKANYDRKLAEEPWVYQTYHTYEHIEALAGNQNRLETLFDKDNDTQPGLVQLFSSYSGQINSERDAIRWAFVGKPNARYSDDCGLFFDPIFLAYMNGEGNGQATFNGRSFVQEMELFKAHFGHRATFDIDIRQKRVPIFGADSDDEDDDDSDDEDDEEEEEEEDEESADGSADGSGDGSDEEMDETDEEEDEAEHDAEKAHSKSTEDAEKEDDGEEEVTEEAEEEEEAEAADLNGRYWQTVRNHRRPDLLQVLPPGWDDEWTSDRFDGMITFLIEKVFENHGQRRETFINSVKRWHRLLSEDDKITRRTHPGTPFSAQAEKDLMDDFERKLKTCMGQLVIAKRIAMALENDLPGTWRLKVRSEYDFGMGSQRIHVPKGRVVQLPPWSFMRARADFLDVLVPLHYQVQKTSSEDFDNILIDPFTQAPASFPDAAPPNNHRSITHAINHFTYRGWIHHTLLKLYLPKFKQTLASSQAKANVVENQLVLFRDQAQPAGAVPGLHAQQAVQAALQAIPAQNQLLVLGAHGVHFTAHGQPVNFVASH